ncbi:MAG: hypothetical protein ACOC1K_04065 [Nanoarchaeota archaeon]
MSKNILNYWYDARYTTFEEMVKLELYVVQDAVVKELELFQILIIPSLELKNIPSIISKN